MTHGLIAVGLWLGLERTDLTPGQRRTTWLAVMIPYTLWIAVAWSAAINGVFRTDASSSPVALLPLAFFLPVIVGAPLLLLSRRVGQLLDAMSAAWLVALQLCRVYGGVFLAAGLHGALPAAFAVPAGIGDALTGLFAVPGAVLPAQLRAEGRRSLGISSASPTSPSRSPWDDHLARPVPVDLSEMCRASATAVMRMC